MSQSNASSNNDQDRARNLATSGVSRCSKLNLPSRSLNSFSSPEVRQLQARNRASYEVPMNRLQIELSGPQQRHFCRTHPTNGYSQNENPAIHSASKRCGTRGAAVRSNMEQSAVFQNAYPQYSHNLHVVAPEPRLERVKRQPLTR
jgi:hypothetical protein